MGASQSGGQHARATAQREIGQDPAIRDPDRPEATRRCPKRILDLFVRCLAHLGRTGRILKFLFRKRMVAAHQHERDLAIQHEDQRLDLVFRGRTTFESNQVFDRVNAGRSELFGCIQAGPILDRSHL
jgi:hypothetical protein